MNTPQANPAAAGRPDPDRVPPPLPPSGPTPGWAPPPPNPGWPAPTVPQGQWQPPHGAPGGPQPGQWQPPGGPGGPQFAAPPQGRPPRRPIIILGLVVGVVVLLAVGGWVAWSVLRDDGPDALEMAIRLAGELLGGHTSGDNLGERLPLSVG